MHTTQLDTLRSVETPEGIEISMTVTGPVARALAWFIDAVLRTVLYMIVGIIISILLPGHLTTGLYLVFLFLMEWFYYVFFDIYREGQSPGKSVMGLRVTRDDGTAVDWPSSMIRNLLRFADFLPFMYGFGLISMLSNPDFKRLGDLVAGTVVVYTETDQKPCVLTKAVPLTPRYCLTLQEQQALVSFAERSSSLTVERNIELSRLTVPLVEVGDNEATGLLEDLLGTAVWISGRR
jgi:uncharacterized RDD family membrane protein YckC